MSKPFTSLEKAISILCLFDTRTKEFSASEISQRLDLPLSSTYKYLDVLQQAGFVSKDPGTKKIFLGLTIFKMGNLASAKISFIDIACPYMQSLFRHSGETVILTVVNGWEALCVEEIESSKTVRLTIKRGATMPLYAGASSKILLAFQDDTFVDSMIASVGLRSLNENTITDPKTLKRNLKAIREQGYTTSDSEVDSGAGAVSAPIFDHKGRLTAGLTIAGPSDRIINNESHKLIEMVRDSAKRISNDLGYPAD